MKMELIEVSETSAISTVTPGNYPKENILQFKCSFIFVNMPHRIHKCINTLYDYVIINY